MGVCGLWTASILGEEKPMPAEVFAFDVFYLAQDASGVVNVHGIALEAKAGVALTHSTIDLYYYDVAMDGRYIAYASRSERGGTSDIVQLFADGRKVVLTDCQSQDIDCRRPAIAPDGERIAYERMVMNSDDVPRPPNNPQIWVWQDGEHIFIAEGIHPRWDDAGDLVYAHLDEPFVLSWQPETLAHGGGFYLAPEDGRMRVYVWHETPDEAIALEDDGTHTYTAVVASEDGRWLLLERRALRGGASEILLYDWQTGTYQLLAPGHGARWR